MAKRRKVNRKSSSNKLIGKTKFGKGGKIAKKLLGTGGLDKMI